MKIIKIFLVLTLSFLSSFAYCQNSIDDKVYSIQEVDSLPKYLGIYKNTKYPNISKEMGINGPVEVGFIVEKDGSTSSLKVNKSLDKFCDAESLRFVGTMKEWKPAIKDGKPVRILYKFTVNFKLDN